MIKPEGAGVPPRRLPPPRDSPPPPSSSALVPQAPPPPPPQYGANRLLGALKKRTNWLKKGKMCMISTFVCVVCVQCTHKYKCVSVSIIAHN